MFIPHCSRYGIRNTQVRYIRSQSHGLYEVTTLHDGMTIAVQPAVMQRVLNVSPNASIGCADITDVQATELGFIVERQAVAV
jgi:hypothetical protein